MPNDAPDLVQSLLRELLSKVETLHTQMNGISIAQATLKGDTAGEILKLGSTFDSKLVLLERRFEEKIEARDEKIDKWLKEMTEGFAQYKLGMEGKITTVTVKMGLVFSLVTALLVAISTAIIKWIFTLPVPVQ